MPQPRQAPRQSPVNGKNISNSAIRPNPYAAKNYSQAQPGYVASLGSATNNYKPQIKPKSAEEDFFHGKSQVSRLDIKKALKGKDVVALARKYKFKVSGPADVNKFSDEIGSLLSKRFGGIIDRAELNTAVKEEFWKVRHMQQAQKNSKEIIAEQNKLKILKNIGGIK